MIIFLWIFAANDRGYGNTKFCHGCIWYTNDILKEYKNEELGTYCRWNEPEFDPPKKFLKYARNPYPLLISFGCILFVFWAATGAIGLVANDTGGCKLVHII